MSDRDEVCNVLARLAQFADAGALDDYLALMTDDIEWEMPPHPPRRGHEAIAEGVRQRRAEGIQGPGTDTMHLVTTIAVTVDGDTATSDSSFVFLRRTAIETLGRYRDEFRRTDGAWKLARRTISFGGA